MKWRKTNLIVALQVLLIMPSFLYAQHATKTVPIPFEDKGACPFECCTYRQWVATETTPVKASHRDDSPVVFRIKKGERVTALTGIVITTKPGKAQVTKPVVIAGMRAKVGDTFQILTTL